MHELTIAQKILEILNESLDDNRKKLLKTVRIRIGKFSNISPPLLESAFSILTEETPLRGARLGIEIPPVKIKCRDCNSVFSDSDFDFCCPECGGNNIDVSDADILEISEIEINPEESNDTD